MDLIEDLIHIFESGGDIAQFCAKHGIIKTDFHRWRSHYPEFEYGYQMARLKGQVYWEKYALDNIENPNFQYRPWRFIMVQRFGYTEKRPIDLPDLSEETLNGKYKKLYQSMSETRIDADEALKVGQLVSLEAKVKAVDEFDKRLQDLEANVGKGEA